jgi:cation:H+ antiporter
MLDPSTWPSWLVIGAFGGAAVVIGVFGTRLTGVAEHLARETGLGQAVFGAVFLGGTTSLPGITTSVTAAAQGHAGLAVSNAIGGIAVQTVFLAVADAAYRKANLEHAAANVANLMQGALLVTLLALPVLGMASPSVTVVGVHPVSLLVLAAYVFGIRLVSGARTAPMWAPARTAETAPDEEPSPAPGRRHTAAAWARFALLGAIVALAGWLVASTGAELSARTGLSESVVGTFFTAIATSLPELVTSVAAVRRGALTLAVGDVLGGNCFDVLFISAADVAFREGSIYEAVGEHELFVIALTVLLTGILLLGLLRREKHGIGNIGFESFLVIVLYLASFALLVLGR